MADDAPEKDEPSGPKVATGVTSKPGTPHMLLRIILGTAGLLLVVGFFLDWIDLPSESYSGLELVTSDNRDIRQAVGETRRWILLVIPVLGVALTAIGFLGLRWAAPIAAGIGLLLIGYGIVTVVALFFQTTAIGLWLIVGAALLALGAGVVALVRARSARSQPREIALREPSTAE